MNDEQRPEENEPELIDAIEAEEIEDPIGDETDGEARTSAGAETEAEIADAEDTAESEAEAEPEIVDEAGTEDESGTDDEAGTEDDEDEPEFKPKLRPPAKLERLQKILAAAGVASRRKAEEMIEQGRVQVNGKVVTELGTKADSGRDHIRVDGKLLQGAERQRYFVLNKPRGFVTTVKDPEGRPTVMQFFDKMRERLYPVGRLDYMSEGLLLVTNDGELANKLTRASAGVEKTYLVKVAGIPSESELDILRAGVAIEKGKPGSGKVRTSPARIRQVRQGDNPWYEVVLIEGRNRELRKMFEEVGHFVEKIRRVGYGPLILDQEPGNLRELDAQELELLRKAADGKLRTPKAKEIRRRNIVDSLPPEKPAFKARGERPAAGPKDYKPKKSFGTDRPVRSGSGTGKFGPAKFGTGRAKFGPARPAEGPTAGPAWKKDDRAARPPARFAPGSSGPRAAGPGPGRVERPAAGRSFGSKPGFKKPEGQQWPQYKRPPESKPQATRRPAPEPQEDLEPRKPIRLHIEPIHETERPDRNRADRSRPARPSSARPGSDRTGSDRTSSDRPSFNRPPSGRSGAGHAGSGRSGQGRSGPGQSGQGRPSSARPFRAEGGLARPFTSSSGKPRPGGARPSSKPGARPYGAAAGRSGPRSTGSDSRPSFGGKRPFESKGPGRSSGASAGPAKRPYTPRGEGGGPSAGRPSRPFTPRTEGAEGFRPREDSRPERKTGSGWKPKPSFGGKSASGDRSRPRSGPKPGGFSKSGPRGKAGGGAKRSGPRPGGKRPGGKRP